MSSLQSQLLNNKKLMKEKARQNQNQNQNQNVNQSISINPASIPTSSTTTPVNSNSFTANHQIKTQETKINTKVNNVPSQNLLSPDTLKQNSKKNKK